MSNTRVIFNILLYQLHSAKYWQVKEEVHFREKHDRKTDIIF